MEADFGNASEAGSEAESEISIASTISCSSDDSDLDPDQHMGPTDSFVEVSFLPEEPPRKRLRVKTSRAGHIGKGEQPVIPIAQPQCLLSIVDQRTVFLVDYGTQSLKPGDLTRWGSSSMSSQSKPRDLKAIAGRESGGI